MTETGQFADLRGMDVRSFRMLAQTADTSRIGMHSARATLLDLTTVVEGEPDDSVAAFRRIPGHQQHIVDAARGYSQLEERLRAGELPRSMVLFSVDVTNASGPSTHVNDVLHLFGAGAEVDQGKNAKKNVTVWESAIPGYHVALKRTENGLEVQAKRRRNAKKIHQ